MWTTQQRRQLQAWTSWRGTSRTLQQQWRANATYYWYSLSWNMPPAYGIHTPNAIKTNSKWYSEEQHRLWRVTAVEKVVWQLCYLTSSGIHSNNEGCRARLWCYAVVHQLVSVSVTPFLIIWHTRDTSKSFKRSQHEIPHPTVNSERASLHLLPKCIRIWNQLSSSLVSAPSLETFKDQLPSNTMYMLISFKF